MTKILVADDEADLEILIKQKFRRQIREHQYEFIFALNGREALEKIQPAVPEGFIESVVTPGIRREPDSEWQLAVLKRSHQRAACGADDFGRGFEGG